MCWTDTITNMVRKRPVGSMHKHIRPECGIKGGYGVDWKQLCAYSQVFLRKLFQLKNSYWQRYFLDIPFILNIRLDYPRFKAQEDKTFKHIFDNEVYNKNE